MMRGSSTPTLYLMCGLPGAGKTTLAKKLEIEKRALRLTPDEWMARIVESGHNEAKRTVVEQIQWELAERTLSLGINVILDCGFWSRSEREDFKSRATTLSARTEIKFLDASQEKLLSRLEERNASLPPDTFHITKEQLILWSSWFEPPSAEELQTS